MQEQQLSYTHTNTYTTVNAFTSKTKNVWVALHGMGYLSRYFAKYFKGLNPEENYIIVPQAASKFYQDKKFKYIGASWLTRENIELEKQNNNAYLSGIWEKESQQWKDQDVQFIFLGYSQGVSTILRWIAASKLHCDKLILHSGAIPEEITARTLTHLPATTKVTYLYGDKDEYINEARVTEQQLKSNAIFGNRLDIQVFDGVHEVHTDFINKVTG